MKGQQLSDNLFSVGLSVNHVDSISLALTASGCAPSIISLTSEAGGKERWINRGKEMTRGKKLLVRSLYVSSSSRHCQRQPVCCNMEINNMHEQSLDYYEPESLETKFYSLKQ